MPTVLPIQSRSKVHEEVRDPPGQHHGDARLTEAEEGVRPKSDLETQGSEEGPGDSGTKGLLQPRAFGSLNRVDPLDSVSNCCLVPRSGQVISKFNFCS